MRKITTLITLLLLFATMPAPAQDSNYDIDINTPLRRNSFFTGGSMGLQFGTITIVDISPQFGYFPLEHLSVGAGFTYQYINDHRAVSHFIMNVYGGRLFTRLYLPVFESIFAHLEYEYMIFQTNAFSYNGTKERIQLHNALAGVGYRQNIGGRSAINLMLLWNFNESMYSLYSNPVIRVGVDVGL
jgi:hypothetical protein